MPKGIPICQKQAEKEEMPKGIPICQKTGRKGGNEHEQGNI